MIAVCDERMNKVEQRARGEEEIIQVAVLIAYRVDHWNNVAFMHCIAELLIVENSTRYL